jgi:DNA polymerase/3'-5' exonuclease PolX
MDTDFSSLKINNNSNKSLFDEFVRYYKFIYSNYAKSGKSTTENYYKLAAIKKTINIIANSKKNISSGEQLGKIKGIGEKTVNRVNEILNTGILSEIKEKENQIDAVLVLSQIRGIGPVKASEFYDKYKIKTIKDLIKKEKEGKITLTREMKLGILYHPVLSTKIPHLFIMEFDNYIQNLILKLNSKTNSNYIAVVCGSYRRKKTFSSDIDVLISNPNLTKCDDTKKYLLPIIQLFTKYFIVNNITENPNKHFQGYASLKNIIKNNSKFDYDFNINKNIIRIDIKIVPIQSFFTALMHYTGSGDFNQKTRIHAKSLGMLLNENGLFDSNNKPLKIDSENDIFKNLLLKYIPPEKRF